jgi:hypothetical protein
VNFKLSKLRKDRGATGQRKTKMSNKGMSWIFVVLLALLYCTHAAIPVIIDTDIGQDFDE